MEHLPLKINETPVYATFSQRFLAGLIDFLIFFPVILAFQYFLTHTITVDISTEILITVVALSYTIIMNFKYGGTVGKLSQGIRITNIDGSKINLLTVIKRSSVDIFLYIVTTYAVIVTLLSLDSNIYNTLDFYGRTDLLIESYPTWYLMAENIMMIWYWSELLVMLTNKRRRALHDFIAGTVVIKKEFCN